MAETLRTRANVVIPAHPTHTKTVVNRAIGGATAVSAGCYAIVTYQVSSMAVNGGSAIGTTGVFAPTVITRHFGPGQVVPATFTAPVVFVNNSTNLQLNATYAIISGVEFANTTG